MDDNRLNKTPTNTINSVLRALDVLLHLGASDRSLGVTEIADELHLSKAVVFRILASLRARDLAEIDAVTHRYHLGPGLLALTEAYLNGLDFRDVCRPIMRELVLSTNETVTLSIRVGFSRTYIDQITPERNVKMIVDVGQSYPLHAGASSKAFLAFLAEDEQESYLRSDLEALTPVTVASPDALRAELKIIRERGYASSAGERDPGAASVAAPIYRAGSTVPVAVMSACGPAERFVQEVDTIAGALLAATRLASARLGHTTP